MTAVPTRFGELHLRLADVSWLDDAVPADESVELAFTPDEDARATKRLLARTRLLAFELLAPQLEARWTWDQLRNRWFIVYLGRNLDEWTEDLALTLRPRRLHGRVVWTASEDYVRDFSRRHWCAAEASLTLCEARGQPVLHRHSKKPLDSRISLGYEDPWYASLYRKTCRSLQDAGSSPDVTSWLQELRAISRDAHEAAAGSAALELYYRLRAALHPYLGALAGITARPLHEPRRHAEVYHLEPAEAAAFFADRAGQMEVVHVGRAARGAGRVLPTQFRAVSHALSIENAPNRYAARSVATVASWVEEVARAIESFVESERASMEEFERIEGVRITNGKPRRTGMLARRERTVKRHERALQALAETRDALHSHACRLPRGQSPLAHAELDAPALNFDARYAELRRQVQRMSRAIRFVDTSEERIPYEVEPFNEVYARWCFVQVVEALLSLGFEFQNEDGLRTTPFYHHPVPHQVNCVMAHPALAEVRVDVWYERRYPLYDPQSGHLYGVETRVEEGRTEYTRVDPSLGGSPVEAKRTPDIALEIFKPGEVVPTIVTLDPTLGGSKDKYEYRDSIRSLVEGDYEPNGEESRRIVGATWGIRPGGKHEHPFIQHRKRVRPDWRSGYLLLRPDTETIRTLPDSLGKILERVLYLPPSTLTSAAAEPRSAA